MYGAKRGLEGNAGLTVCAFRRRYSAQAEIAQEFAAFQIEDEQPPAIVAKRENSVCKTDGNASRPGKPELRSFLPLLAVNQTADNFARRTDGKQQPLLGNNGRLREKRFRRLNKVFAIRKALRQGKAISGNSVGKNSGGKRLYLRGEGFPAR